MAEQAKIAIFSPEGLQLEAFLDLLAESELADAEVCLLGVSEGQGETAMYAGRPLGFHAIDDFDFSDVQLLLVLESALVVEAYNDLLSTLACPVLGFHVALRDLDAELLLGKMPESRVAGVPLPAVQAVCAILQGATVEALDLTLFYPAALYGQAGIQELASQTARLLNAQSLEHKVFPKQLPFNYYPLVESQSGRDIEADMLKDCQAVFDDADVHVRGVQMPVFHGMAALVSVVLSDEVDLSAWEQQWQNNGLVTYQSGVNNLSNLEVLQNEATATLGDVRKSAYDEHRLDFWVGLDDARFGVTQNLISVAEFLLKHHL